MVKIGEKIKRYSDLKMANIIALFIDIATDHRAPILPVLLIICCFFLNRKQINLIDCVRSYL